MYALIVKVSIPPPYAIVRSAHVPVYMHNSLQDPNLLYATACPSLLLQAHVQVPRKSMPRGRGLEYETGDIETDTASPFFCVVIAESKGSLMSSTFVPLGVVTAQSVGMGVLGLHVMVRMSTVSPGLMHKSQPISMSTMIKNCFTSIGGGG